MSDPISSLGNFQSLSKGSLMSNLNELGTQLRDANTDDLSKFWQNIVGSFDLVVDDLLCQRIMLFLPQFIHSTERLDEFLKFFGHIGLTNGLINYLNYSNDQQFEDIEDIILEILSNASSVIKPNEFYGRDQELPQLLIILQTCSKLLQPFNNPEQEAPEAFGEVLDYLSKLCYNITLLDDSQAFSDSNIIQNIIKRWGFIESSTQGQLNIYDFVAIWQYLNNNETKSEVSEIDFLLLQGLLKDISLFKDSNLTRDNYTFFGELLTNAITDTNANSNVSITFILEKLKTIGITLQNFIKNNVTPDVLIALIYNQDSELFQTNFLQPLTRFFTNLNDFLKSQNFDDFQSKALLNNSKFVAATSITFLEPFSNSSDSLEVCKAIIQYKILQNLFNSNSALKNAQPFRIRNLIPRGSGRSQKRQKMD
ncbi:hypothetical protein QCA50_009282 [Cerrena zonata]|uniref:Uncharacterized protein n=1 Tax=Cerrena zonata TaxID=2478898 RepID=A0AAW0GBX1_9APHY